MISPLGVDGQLEMRACFQRCCNQQASPSFHNFQSHSCWIWSWWTQMDRWEAAVESPSETLPDELPRVHEVIYPMGRGETKAKSLSQVREGTVAPWMRTKDHSWVVVLSEDTGTAPSAAVWLRLGGSHFIDLFLLSVQSVHLGACCGISLALCSWGQRHSPQE